jgi:amidase
MTPDLDPTGGRASVSRRQFVSASSATLMSGLIKTLIKTSDPMPKVPMPANPKSEQDPEGLHYTDAQTLSRLIRSREVSTVEVMTAFLDQIERVNPRVNAIPTLRPRDELLDAARAADAALSRGEITGPFHGMPLAIKDLVATKGIRTTFGSRIYQDFVPDTDELFVERFKRAGAIIIGKTNTPEFGAGSQTFNEVFGTTLNPHDLTRTCGGSSGGAAVALACGMVPLADGSDLGGSLRNPASFSNVVGFRPSPGRVPRFSTQAWNTMPVQGPMARTVADIAFLLSVMAGPDARDPIALDDPGASFLRPLPKSFRGTRVAWSQDLGRYPVEPAVNEVCNASRRVFEELGCEVDDGEPDFSGVDDIFQTLRAWGYGGMRDELEQNRHLMKDTVIWNIERGLDLTARDIAEAEEQRTALYQRVMAFLQEYEYLILPVSQVAPFSTEVDWVREINGVRMETYIDWMATCYAITCTGLPAISVPCGFTPDGLPIGLQIVGRHHRDFEVLQLAHAFEQATGYGRRRPAVATGE